MSNLIAWFYIWENCNDCFTTHSLKAQENAKFMLHWAAYILDNLSSYERIIFKDLFNAKLKEAKISLELFG